MERFELKKIAKKTAKKAVKHAQKEVIKDFSKQLEQFDNDLYAAMGAWIGSGKRISNCLGDFYVRQPRHMTTFCNPFIAMILQNKIKIKQQYYNDYAHKNKNSDLDYERTVAHTLSDEYGLPAVFLRGYNQGLVSPFNTSQNYLKSFHSMPSYRGYDLEKNLSIFHSGAKKGMELHAIISHILYTDY
jgi:hypothetical protein